MNTNKLYNKILNSEPQIPLNVSSEAAQLIRKMLSKNPKHRPQIDEILNNLHTANKDMMRPLSIFGSIDSFSNLIFDTKYVVNCSFEN